MNKRSLEIAEYAKETFQWRREHLESETRYEALGKALKKVYYKRYANCPIERIAKFHANNMEAVRQTFGLDLIYVAEWLEETYKEAVKRKQALKHKAETGTKQYRITMSEQEYDLVLEYLQTIREHI